MKSSKAVIHFETQRENKARWVKQAQRDGKKLSQWIEDCLNEKSKPLPGRCKVNSEIDSGRS